MEELKDYTSLDISEFLVADTSVLTEYAQTDSLAFDQAFEGVPGGNIIFGGMQIRKKKYSDVTTAGVWVGVDVDGVGKINIGDNSNFLLWNGSSLTVSGAITATSGTIGGWVIGADTLSSAGGEIVLDSDGETITGGTIRTSSTGERVQMLSSTNTLQIIDSSGDVRAESYSNGWQFNTSSEVAAGRVFIENTFNNLQIQAVTSDLFLTSVDDITFAPGNGSISFYIDGTTKDVVLNSGDLDISSGDLILGSTTIVGGGSWTLTLPPNNGTNGEFLMTDGSGDTSWETVSAGADTDLNNLTTTSINEHLIPEGSTQDLGTSSLPWDRLYVDDIYLTNDDGGIYYNSNLALDFYATEIRLGSTYDDFSPASALAANLGDAFRWNLANFDSLDVSGTVDAASLRFSTGEDITGNGSDIEYDADTDHVFFINSSLTAVIDDNIFTEGDLLANGSKPFLIPHPDGSKRLLRYTAQESPEVLLRHRGKATLNASGKVIIKFPKHFIEVTDPAGEVTANLTSVGNSLVYLAEEPTNAELKVQGAPNTSFHFEVMAIRDGYLNKAVEISSRSPEPKDKELYQKMSSVPTRNVKRKAEKAKQNKMVSNKRARQKTPVTKRK